MDKGELVRAVERKRSPEGRAKGSEWSAGIFSFLSGGVGSMECGAL